MDGTVAIINELLAKNFNDILFIEESALKQGIFSDLTLTEMHTVEAIGMYAQKTMGQVARTLSITVGTLTVAVNSLVRKSYAERSRDGEDRRFVKVSLSNKGRLAYRAHEKFHADMVKSMVDGLSEDEELVLASALGKLNEYLRKFQNIYAKAGGGA
ncbi:MAG: MarR family winged helix-turn-helix transcriptional regulator [Defluviitaleaceae bacterium]|nr:MarR family winged helix-turn-helix transcriptional regulator [Defluviitaleaceae bacterium]